MTSIFDYEHLNAMLFAELTTIMEAISDEFPDTALECVRQLKSQSNAIAPTGNCLTRDT